MHYRSGSSAIVFIPSLWCKHFVEELSHLLSSTETEALDESLEYTYSKIPLTAQEAVDMYLQNANNRR